MSDATIVCRCCGVPVFGARQRFRVCPICDLCAGKHGRELLHEVAARLNNGTIHPWLVVAVCAFDDAWLSGKMEIDPATGCVHVAQPPKRWEVVLAWARCRKETAPMRAVLEAALAPYMHMRGTQATIEAAKSDIRTALIAFDGSLVDVEIAAFSDPQYPDGVVFQVQFKAPCGGGHDFAPEVEIPAGIMSGPRGQA